MKRREIIQLLEYLDGNGIILVDEELVNEALLAIIDKDGDINPS